MSRIGKKPVVIPSGIEVKVNGSVVTIAKGKDQLTQELDPRINVEVKDGNLILSRADETKEVRSLHGLYRSLINNMIEGLEKGFSKTLIIDGVGYKVEQKGNGVVFSLGLSHTIEYDPPEGITFELPKPNQLKISGADKQMVGETAAKIRALRPPEPYKGKGIRYIDEVVRLKEGKTGA